MTEPELKLCRFCGQLAKCMDDFCMVCLTWDELRNHPDVSAEAGRMLEDSFKCDGYQLVKNCEAV